jgi:predicted  nucleic acid-binding Zn-ribbon protein
MQGIKTVSFKKYWKNPQMLKGKKITLEDLAIMIAEGFEEFNTRLTSLEQRMDRVEARLDKVEMRLDRVENLLDQAAYKFELQKLEQRVEKLENLSKTGKIRQK